MPINLSAPDARKPIEHLPTKRIGGRILLGPHPHDATSSGGVFVVRTLIEDALIRWVHSLKSEGHPEVVQALIDGATQARFCCSALYAVYRSALYTLGGHTSMIDKPETFCVEWGNANLWQYSACLALTSFLKEPLTNNTERRSMTTVSGNGMLPHGTHNLRCVCEREEKDKMDDYPSKQRTAPTSLKTMI